MNVVVIGGGASGLIAAGRSAETGNKVILLEKNEKLGKKLYITGKGRCNLTNVGEDLFSNIVRNEKFLYSAFKHFSVNDTIKFFNDLGLNTKIERGNRVFPISDKSSDVIKALESYCKKNSVQICLNTEVVSIQKNNNEFIVNTKNGRYECDAVILSTGGVSYPLTGSTGSGYEFALKLGHNIIELKSALCPIVLKDEYISSWEGISLKNVELKAYKDNKLIKSLFGEMLFTKNGISGPIALSMSSYINRLNNIYLKLDFKPALSLQQIDNRLLREIDLNKNMETKSLIRKLLPNNIVEQFLNVAKISLTKKVNSLTKEERCVIANLLKNYPLTYKCLEKIDYSIVTSGGVDCKQVNPKTMESKIVENLFFTGEILDLDALTGGYNLQIAWSTGYLAGSSIGRAYDNRI